MSIPNFLKRDSRPPVAFHSKGGGRELSSIGFLEEPHEKAHEAEGARRATIKAHPSTPPHTRPYGLTSTLLSNLHLRGGACIRPGLHFNLCFLLFLIMFLVAACGLDLSPTANGTPGTSPTSILTTPTPALNVWNKGGPGVEVRYEDWKSPGGAEDIVTIVRLDPHLINLSVGYQPTQPLLLSAWMQQEQATAIINGGYFDQNDNATGLVVSNGQTYGDSYDGFGGMLSVDAQGNINLRSLHEQPYDPNSEQLQQATQSSPMLVLPGGQRADFSANATGSRRSVVAMDKQGRLLFIVCPDLEFSLDELADQLVSSDLSIDVALNLDGGASTGLFVNSGSQQVAIDSMAKLPIVIIVKAK